MKGKPSLGHPDSCGQALRDIAEPRPHSLCQLPVPAPDPEPAQPRHHLCLHSEARSKGHGQRVSKPFPQQLPGAGEGGEMHVHSWRAAPPGKYLVEWTPVAPAAQPPALASGNSLSDLPWGSVPAPCVQGSGPPAIAKVGFVTLGQQRCSCTSRWFAPWSGQWEPPPQILAGRVGKELAPALCLPGQWVHAGGHLAPPWRSLHKDTAALWGQWTRGQEKTKEGTGWDGRRHRHHSPRGPAMWNSWAQMCEPKNVPFVLKLVGVGVLSCVTGRVLTSAWDRLGVEA